MGEKIDLGHGAYLEPDDGPRDSRWHMKIERTQRIAGMRNGHWLYLACGHRSMAFGNLEYAGGVVLCTQCRDAAKNSQLVLQVIKNT